MRYHCSSICRLISCLARRQGRPFRETAYPGANECPSQLGDFLVLGQDSPGERYRLGLWQGRWRASPNGRSCIACPATRTCQCWLRTRYWGRASGLTRGPRQSHHHMNPSHLAMTETYWAASTSSDVETHVRIPCLTELWCCCVSPARGK